MSQHFDGVALSSRQWILITPIYPVCCWPILQSFIRNDSSWKVIYTKEMCIHILYLEGSNYFRFLLRFSSYYVKLLGRLMNVLCCVRTQYFLMIMTMNKTWVHFVVLVILLSTVFSFVIRSHHWHGTKKYTIDITSTSDRPREKPSKWPTFRWHKN
jgi:hypothetical protein